MKLGVGSFFAAVGLVACGTAATRDSSTAPPRAGMTASKDAGAVAVADAASEAVPVEAAAAPKAPTAAFYAVAQGACPTPRPVLVGKTQILHFPKEAWAIGSDGTTRPIARQLPPHYDAMAGVPIGHNDHLSALGGVDEDHIWYTMGLSTGRGEDASYVVYRDKVLKTPEGFNGFFGMTHILQQPDGSFWAYGVHSMYLDIPGDEKLHGVKDPPAWHYNRWFAWSKDGAELQINLPKGDMQNAQRLATGELVTAGLSANGNAMLRRWSPTRPVNDLRTPDAHVAPDMPDLKIGSTRAVLRPAKHNNVFYNYLGDDKLALSGITKRAKGVESWLVSAADELLVTTKEGTLFVESKDGAITESQLPEPGRLAAEPVTPWLMAASGAVYERADGAWRKLTLPDGLWSAETHPPNKVEWVRVLGDETWVGTVRTDAGFGFKNPSEVRTFYSSKPRPAPIRCGSPFETGALLPFPPRADASCKELVVVLGREYDADQKPTYPKIAAALKGDAALGDTLTFIDFGEKTKPARPAAYGFRASTPAIAQELVKKLARVTAHEPEIVCGAPHESRRLAFDVKAGTFAPAAP